MAMETTQLKAAKRLLRKRGKELLEGRRRLKKFDEFKAIVLNETQGKKLSLSEEELNNLISDDANLRVINGCISYISKKRKRGGATTENNQARHKL